MRTIQVLWLVVCLSWSAHAQYNYQQHQETDGYQQRQPAPTYLPPTTPTPAPVTKNPYESETDVAAEGNRPPPVDDQDGWAKGMPYDFTYAVKDDFGNDFAHKADSDGEVVKGEYRTLLPDGRMQIVKYTADWKNGFNADVSYEGQAAYPEERPNTPRPYNPPPPPPSTRQPYFPPVQTTRQPYVQPTPKPNDEFEEDIDSQGLYPNKNPVTYPTTSPPFRCYPGSTDYRCAQPTNPPPPPPPNCYYGSTDSRCPPPQTNRPVCYPGSTDTRCPQPTTPTPFSCYPGSTDYRCPQPTTQQPFRCYPGAQDPRCPTQRTTPEPPTQPPGLYGAPSLPFGVRNSPKFGYNKK